jgi:lysylphosphatidylglycerol synthetase-like protein (DUF2156 family)
VIVTIEINNWNQQESHQQKANSAVSRRFGLLFSADCSGFFALETEKKFNSKFNSITNGRWTAYMAAAAASGFAAAHTAEATIHYSGLIN